MRWQVIKVAHTKNEKVKAKGLAAYYYYAVKLSQVIPLEYKKFYILTDSQAHSSPCCDFVFISLLYTVHTATFHWCLLCLCTLDFVLDTVQNIIMPYFAFFLLP